MVVKSGVVMFRSVRKDGLLMQNYGLILRPAGGETDIFGGGEFDKVIVKNEGVFYGQSPASSKMER